MLKEIKYIIYLLVIFFFIFFPVKFYFSEVNIKQSNMILNLHEKELDKKFINLPIIENDTNDIIEYKNDVEKYNNTKKRKFWDLIK